MVYFYLYILFLSDYIFIYSSKITQPLKYNSLLASYKYIRISDLRFNHNFKLGGAGKKTWSLATTHPGQYIKAFE